MPSFNVDFEVWCSCGEGLCHQADTRGSCGQFGLRVTIDPCEKCLEAAKNEGYDAGLIDGYAEREAADVANLP